MRTNRDAHDVAVFNDTLDVVLNALDGLQREVLMMRLSHYSISEIAEKIERTERSVQRALAAIRTQLLHVSDEA